MITEQALQQALVQAAVKRLRKRKTPYSQEDDASTLASNQEAGLAKHRLSNSTRTKGTGRTGPGGTGDTIIM